MLILAALGLMCWPLGAVFAYGALTSDCCDNHPHSGTDWYAALPLAVIWPLVALFVLAVATTDR